MVAAESKSIATLDQKMGWRRRDKFVLYPDRLEVEVSTSWSMMKGPIPLQVLKPDPDLVKRPRAKDTTLGALCLFVLILLLIAPFMSAKFDRTQGWKWKGTIGIIAVGAVVAGGAFVFFRRAFEAPARFWVLAYGPQGQPSLIVASERPSENDVRTFLSELKRVREREVEVLESRSEEAGLRYTKELERFKQLSDRGVLTAEEYAEVKLKLLGLGERRMGFRP